MGLHLNGMHSPLRSAVYDSFELQRNQTAGHLSDEVGLYRYSFGYRTYR